MSTRSARTPSSPDFLDGHCPSAVPPWDWAAEQLGRVLRLREGAGPEARRRIESRTRALINQLQGELPTGTEAAEHLSDHLWSALLRAGQPQAARFFRPYRTSGGPILWVRHGARGAEPLAWERVEGLLERQCRGLGESDLDPARIHVLCRARLHSGMDAGELARVLALTSPAQCTVLGRLSAS